MDRFGTSNPALAKILLDHSFLLELGRSATSKFSHKPISCLDLCSRTQCSLHPDTVVFGKAQNLTPSQNTCASYNWSHPWFGLGMRIAITLLIIFILHVLYTVAFANQLLPLLRTRSNQAPQAAVHRVITQAKI